MEPAKDDAKIAEAEIANLYPFLVDDSDNRLEILINNYLSLGQYELARGHLLQLAKIADRPRAIVLSKLRYLSINGPQKNWLSSPSVPTEFHLAWLCASDYHQIIAEKKLDGFDPLPAQLLSALEFEILLENVFQEASEASQPTDKFSRLKDELRWYFACGSGLLQRTEYVVLAYANRWTAPLQFSPECLSLLRRSFAKQPALGNALLNQLISAVSSSTSLSSDAVTLPVELRTIFLDLIESALDSKRYSDAIRYLPFLYTAVITHGDGTSRTTISSSSASPGTALAIAPSSSFSNTRATSILLRLAALVNSTAPLENTSSDIAGRTSETVELLPPPASPRQQQQLPQTFSSSRLAHGSASASNTPPIDQVLTELLSMSRDISKTFGGQVSPMPPSSPVTTSAANSLLPPSPRSSTVLVVPSPAPANLPPSTLSAPSTSPTEITPLLLRTRIYEAFLQSPDSAELLKWFSAIEDDQILRRSFTKADPYPSFFMQYSTTTAEQKDFWIRLYHFVRVTKKHFAEFVLETSLKLLKEGNSTAAASLLKPFPQLNNLLVMMSWQMFAAAPQTAIPALQSLLTLFYTPNISTQTELHLHVSQLAYELYLAKWCAEKSTMLQAKLRIDSTTAISSSSAASATSHHPSQDQPVVLAHAVLSQLQSGRDTVSGIGNSSSAPHSLLYLLSHSLSQFPIEEVLALYQLPFPLPPQAQWERERDWELLCIYSSVAEAIAVLRASSSSSSALSDIELNSRTRILSYLSQLSHHQSHRVAVLEILYSLIFTEQKAKRDGSGLFGSAASSTEKYITSAAFVKWTVELLQTLIDEQYERDYVRQSLRTKSDVRQRLLSIGTSEELIQQLEARVNRLQLLLVECTLRLRVAEVALSSPAQPSAQLNFMVVFLMPADALAQLCLRCGDVLQLRQVLDAFKTSLSAAVLAYCNVQQELASLQLSDAPAAIPRSLEPLLNALEPQERLLTLCDLAVTCPSARLSSAFLRQAQSLLTQLLSASQATPKAVEATMNAIQSSLKRYQSLTSSASLQPLVTQLSSFESRETRDSTTASNSNNNNSMLSYLSSQKIMLEGLTQLRTTLNLLERGAAGLDVESQIRNLISSFRGQLPETSATSETSPQKEREELASSTAYLPNFLQYLLTLGSKLSYKEKDNFFALLNESPIDIVAKLIFEKKNYRLAEEISSVLGADLGIVLLSQLSSRAETLDPSIFLDVITYISRTYPLAGAVAALHYVPPSSTHEFILQLLDMALNNTQKSEVLHNWVKLRLETYANLFSLFSQFPAPASKAGLSMLTTRISSSSSNSPNGSASALGSSPAVPPASSSAAIAPADMNLLIATLRSESSGSAATESGNDISASNVYALLVERLVLCGEYERAVQLANAHLPQGAGDTLIVMLLDNSTAVHSASALHVARISDAETCAEMCLKYYSLWPSSELCVRIIGSCLRRLQQNANARRNSDTPNPTSSAVAVSLRRPALQRIYDQMVCYNAILTHCPKWRKQDSHAWQFIAEKCRTDLVAVLCSILDAKQFKLARQALGLFASNAQPAIAVVDFEDQIEALEIFDLLELGEVEIGMDRLAALHKPTPVHSGISSVLARTSVPTTRTDLSAAKFLLLRPQPPMVQSSPASSPLSPRNQTTYSLVSTASGSASSVPSVSLHSSTVSVANRIRARYLLAEYVCQEIHRIVAKRQTKSSATAGDEKEDTRNELQCFAPSEIDSVRQRKQSLQMLSTLPHELAVQLLALEEHPVLILETLIMNERVSELEKICGKRTDANSEFRSLAQDLIHSYAKKAIFSAPPHRKLQKRGSAALSRQQSSEAPSSLTSVISSTLPSSNSANFVHHLKFLLSGNAEDDRVRRNSHVFPSAPNISLLKSLLELSDSPGRCGSTCFEIFRQLAELMTASSPAPSPSSSSHSLSSPPSAALVPASASAVVTALSTVLKERGSDAAAGALLVSGGVSISPAVATAAYDDTIQCLHVISLMRQLLLFAKLQFLRDANPNVSSGAALCDSFMSYVDLYQSMSLFKTMPSFSVLDFHDPNKARQLRDWLMEGDRMSLALEVASKCNADPVRVCIQWGSQLLRLGKYPEAREKFHQAMTAPVNAISTAAKTVVDGSELLAKILETIEMHKGGNSAADIIATNQLSSTGYLEAYTRQLREEYSQLAAKISPALANSSGPRRTHSSHPSTPSTSTPSTPARAPPASPLPKKDSSAFANDLRSPAPPPASPLSRVLSSSMASPPSTPVRRNLNGQFDTVARDSSAIPRSRKALDPVREQECLYYIQKYGSPKDKLDFYLRRDQIAEALEVYLSSRMSTQMFPSIIFAHCLAHENLSELFAAIGRMDPMTCNEHLLAVCRFLYQKKAFVVLLEVQRFMGDISRAALTCLRLFQEQSDFDARMFYLEQARELFKDLIGNKAEREKLQERFSSADSSLPTLSDSELSKMLKTINLQIEVTGMMASLQAQFMAKSAKDREKEKESIAALQHASSLSLLEKRDAVRSELAEFVMVQGGYDLAVRVIQDCRLPVTAIYSNAIRKISRRKQEARVLEMLRAIKGTVTDEEWDRVVLCSIAVFARELSDAKTAEKFVSRLAREESRVDAYVLCGKLKSAYITAVKEHLVEKVKMVRDEARRDAQQTVLELCDKFLAATPPPVANNK